MTSALHDPSDNSSTPRHSGGSNAPSTSYRGPERRRASWRKFRESYSTFLKLTAAILLFLVAANMWLAYRRNAYVEEIARLRASMTQAEREKSDLVVRSEQDKVRMGVELAKRQARWSPQLHLSIAVDSGRMYLERDGALLREMTVSIIPAALPGADTMIETIPRGERTIEDIQRDSVSKTETVLLTGGLRIYASSDTTQVVPGSVRVQPADMKAILSNLAAGMVVYFY